jgi:hypothetical protein
MKGGGDYQDYLKTDDAPINGTFGRSGGLKE